MKQSQEKIICQNKKAYHNYFIEDELEAGVVLKGTEIKSLRMGKVSINEAYCEIKQGEMFIVGMNISLYEKGNIFNHQPTAKRKLLLHHKEILKLLNKTTQNGYTIIPLRIALRHGIAKIDLGVARGKKLYDKREEMKKEDDIAYIKKVAKETYNV